MRGERGERMLILSLQWKEEEAAQRGRLTSDSESGDQIESTSACEAGIKERQISCVCVCVSVYRETLNATDN